MGTHQGGNGGNVPPDGDRSPDDPTDLPELPAEWGKITIPDDLSEIEDEVEEIRQELASGRQPEPAPTAGEPAPGEREPSVGVPLLIMSVAVVVTLVSLFAMAWSGSTAPPQTGADADGAPARELPRVALTGDAGTQVPLSGQAPAVILLVEQCEDCSQLTAATLAAAPAGVTVLAVGNSVPAEPPGVTGDTGLIRLADPNGVLRDELELGPPTNAATVVLVDQDRQITRTAEDVTSVGQFQPALTDLG